MKKLLLIALISVPALLNAMDVKTETAPAEKEALRPSDILLEALVELMEEKQPGSELVKAYEERK